MPSTPDACISEWDSLLAMNSPTARPLDPATAVSDATNHSRCAKRTLGAHRRVGKRDDVIAEFLDDPYLLNRLLVIAGDQWPLAG